MAKWVPVDGMGYFHTLNVLFPHCQDLCVCVCPGWKRQYCVSVAYWSRWLWIQHLRMITGLFFLLFLFFLEQKRVLMCEISTIASSCIKISVQPRRRRRRRSLSDYRFADVSRGYFRSCMPSGASPHESISRSQVRNMFGKINNV